MKVNFYTDHRKMTVLSPDELVEFRDEREARQFLTMFAQDPTNLETLRRVLGEQYNPFVVSTLTDSEVLDHVARVVARSCLGWVRVELREIVPPAVAEGAASQDDRDMEGDPLTEQEAEYEEVKPDPVLPPLFPIIARLECEALDLQRKLYNITLDLLRYAGWPWPDESEVADRLQSVANRTRQALGENAEGFSNQLLGLGEPANLLDKATQVGDKLVKTADKTGKDLETIAGKTSEGLQKLLENDGEDPAPSRVIPALQNVVENQSEQVTKITEAASAGLSKLAEGEFEPAEPSQMAELLQSFAVEQGKGVADAAQRASDLVKEKLSKGMDQKEELPSLDGSLLLEAMTATIGDTSQGIINSVGGAVDVLLPLGALPKPVEDAEAAAAAAGEAVEGALGGAAGDAEAAAEAGLEAAAGAGQGGLAEATQLAAGDLTKQALRDIRPPDWLRDGDGKPSEVITKMHLTLLDQTEGVLRATYDATDYLRRLAPQPPAVDLDAEGAAAEAEAALAAGDAAMDAAADAAAAAGDAVEDAADAVDEDVDEVTLAAREMLARLGVEFDESTVTDMLGNPSELGSTIKNTVFDQGVSLVGLALQFKQRVAHLAPPLVREVLDAVDAATADASAAAADASAAVADRAPLPSEAREPYTIPEPPPVPDYTYPEVDLPAWDILGEGGDPSAPG